MDTIWTLLSWGPDGWSDDMASGVLVTVLLALATLPIGLVIGFFVALAKQSGEPSLRLAANIYTTIFRGIPELVVLFLIYFGAQIAIQQIFAAFGYQQAMEINSFVAGMVALGVVLSSYSSEVFLSAFRAIPPGQYEGGYAVGLSYGRTMLLIILPQLIRIALPGLENLWLILLKDTAIVSVIGLADILRQANIAARVSKHAFLFYSYAILLFLFLAIASSFVIRAIERSVGREPGR